MSEQEQLEAILSSAEKAMRQKRKHSIKPTVSNLTKLSQGILQDWKNDCQEKFCVDVGDPNSTALQFAVHDKSNGIVYELKANGSNPYYFLDKIVRKLIVYQTWALEEPNNYPPIRKVYCFMYPAVCKRISTGNTARLVEALQAKFGIDLSFIPINVENTSVL